MDPLPLLARNAYRRATRVTAVRVAGIDGMKDGSVLVAATILFGMLATVWGTAIDRYAYRDTVSVRFLGIFTFHPHEALMANALFLFHAHALTAWLLLAIWPFTRLVHAWSVPVAYVGRAPYPVPRPRARWPARPRPTAEGCGTVLQLRISARE